MCIEKFINVCIYIYTFIYKYLCIYVCIYIYIRPTRRRRVPGPGPSWNPPRRRVIPSPLMNLLELRSSAICSINALCLYYMSI